MDDALTILDYLPASFKNTAEQQYITFLWEAFESNYQSGKYQFAMLAFHMLYMSFVYFSVWQIKIGRPNDFAKAILFQQKDQEKAVLQATSPFTFSSMQESSIFNFLRLIDGCEREDTGKYANFVKDRNNMAHSNGVISVNGPAAADTKIAEILKQVVAIHAHMQPVIHDCLYSFLGESWNAEERECLEVEDEIREVLVYKNYFSQKDIAACLAFDISTLREREHFAETSALFEAFAALYRTDD